MKNYSSHRKGRDMKDDRQMHKTTCSDCGKSCQVPFKPTSSKPVYCSNCFKKDSSPRGNDRRGGDRRGGDRRDGGGRGDRGRLEMHKTVCDDCGKNCEVPFKPTGDKPVYCSDCFGNEGRSGRGSSSRPEQPNNEISEKLDKIIDLLERMVPEDKKKKVIIVPKKAPTKKKTAPKKTTVKKKTATKKVVKKVAKKAPAKKKATKK